MTRTADPVQAKVEADVRGIGGVIIALMAVGVLALLIAGGFAVWTLRQGEVRAEQVQHTRQVEAALLEAGVLAERSEAARRGYLIVRDQRFREVWRQTYEDLLASTEDLVRLTADNPPQRERAMRLQRSLGELQSLERVSIALADQGRAAEAQTALGADNSAQLLRDIRALGREMTGVEARLLEERTVGRREALNNFYVILTICALLVLAIIGAAILVIRRYTTALTASRQTLQRLNVDLEGAVAERTGELQRANEEIQRFAYIVSHDLRSPLVNVMGFTSELESARAPLARMVQAVETEHPDLVAKDAKLAVEEDLPEAIRFIRSSTEKMDRLINAILKLSREGRRNLAAERLDMNALVRGAADALHHRTEASGTEIEIAALPDMISDRTAIDQIFSNLIENAVKYLKPGRPGRIAVTGRKDGERRLYEITDNGRGIDPRDHQRIFDLFRRSGQQDQPGEGIGLAHVRSLVWRLGGTIEVDSKLDEGATFRLSLPSGLSGKDVA